MAQEIPDGVRRLSVENFPENKIGRQTYTYRLDPSKFRKDRDFHVEWIDGPVRFSVSRDDHADYWLFKAEPAGAARGMRDGYEEDGLTGSVRGGGGTQRTTISPAREGYQESFGKGDIIYVKTTIDLWANPFEVRHGYSSEQEGHLGFTKSLTLTVDTNSDDHRVSTEMVEAQVKTLARHVVQKYKHAVTKDGPKGALKRVKEYLTNPVHAQKNGAVAAALDTAYLLGLRDETAYATSVRGQGYTNVPPHAGDGANEKLSPTAKKIGRRAWQVGLIDKPKFVEWEEKLEQRRREQREAQQSPPPREDPRGPRGGGEPSEKNNTCPNDECGGRYHKKDLETKSIDKQNGMLTGTEWVCPDCGATVGSDVDYHGPVPVETPHGTELH